MNPPAPYTLLALVGGVLLVTRGSPFAWLRRRRVLWGVFSCALCSGFWLGLVAGGLRRTTLATAELLGALEDGCAVAVLSLLVDAVLGRLLGASDEPSTPET